MSYSTILHTIVHSLSIWCAMYDVIGYQCWFALPNTNAFDLNCITLCNCALLIPCSESCKLSCLGWRHPVLHATALCYRVYCIYLNIVALHWTICYTNLHLCVFSGILRVYFIVWDFTTTYLVSYGNYCITLYDTISWRSRSYYVFAGYVILRYTSRTYVHSTGCNSECHVHLNYMTFQIILSNSLKWYSAILYELYDMRYC